MRYRNLGKTDISISEIGFGAWGIGGLSEGEATSYGKTDDNESKRALKKAYEMGINFYDTSNIYGDGHSEELIASVFKNLREKIIIASKVGFLKHNGPQDFSKKNITQSLEGTLKRLKTDYLDLYQLHSAPLDILKKSPETLETMLKLKEEGKIKAIGISARSPEEGTLIAKNYPFESIQINFNLVDQRVVESGFMNICQEKGIGVIVRTPLCFGFLSGKYKDYQFNKEDHRSAWTKEQRAIWANAPNLFLNAIDDRTNQTNSQIALRYCLSYPAVSTVIPGMLNEKEVIENSQASKLGALKKEEILRLERVYQENKFFLGK
jgi:aryl-alcohol dehydrogenase-like predicted oxidoreductase